MSVRFPTKIPTVLGILITVLLVVLVSIGSNHIIASITKAEKSIEPKNVLATNITDTSFTVTWTTADIANGSILFGTDSGKTFTVIDERDTPRGRKKYYTHSCTVRDLKPNTVYKYKILSNDKQYSSGNSEFTIKTAQTLAPSNQSTNLIEPSYGTIFTPDNKPATGAIVYITLPGSQTLSTLARDSGSWIIPLNLIRKENLSEFVTIEDRLDEQITVRYYLDLASAITDTLNDSPVPAMVIGKSYDFRKQRGYAPSTRSLALIPTPKSEESSQSKQTVLGDQSQKSSAKPYVVSLVQPADNAILISNTPLFQGTGVPGKTISLTLGIKNPTTHSIQVETDGIWRFTPPAPLPAGKQSVTVTSVNTYGKPVAITHTFDILKSGTQVLGDATPSASLTPSPQTTAFPTSTPVISPSPTIEAVPTSTESANPRPTSGSGLPTVLLILLGIGLLTGGTALLFK